MPEAEQAAMDVAADLALIADAARQGGEIAMRYFGGTPEVWMKAGASPVSEADYAVDRYLSDTLRAARPDYGWLSEETADTPDRLGLVRTFIVDPIDGTRAFLDGRDTWCISIAVVEHGRPVAGVLACPATKEFFSASLGGGAYLDGRRLGVSQSAGAPVIAGPKPMIDAARSSIGELSAYAYVPSLAYRVALIAAGRIDATFVKPNSNDWDLAAADLILEEAGGAVLDPSGQRLRYGGADTRHGSLVAGSSFLLEKLTAVLAGL